MQSVEQWNLRWEMPDLRKPKALPEKAQKRLLLIEAVLIEAGFLKSTTSMFDTSKVAVSKDTSK